MRSASLVFAAIVCAAFLGCSKNDGADPSLRDVAGIWIEDRSAVQPSRVEASGPVKNPNLIQLTLDASGSFTFQYVTPEGKPVAADKTVSGTWKWDRGVRFTISSNSLEEKLKNDVPVAASGATKIPDTDSWRLSVALEERGQVRLKRQPR